MSVKTKRPVTNLKVQYTKDYSLFQKVDTNRDLRKSNLNKIRKSMLENGLMVDPIKVNEYYEVIDGQHRLNVSQELGLGIYYIKVKGIGKKEMMDFQIHESWKMTDFLKHYVKEGNPNYVKIKKFMDEFPMFSITDSCVFLNGGNQTVKGDGFREGTYLSGSLNEGRELALQIMKLQKPFPQGYTRTIFVRTLLQTNRTTPNFSMEEFVKKSMIVPNEYFQIKGDRKGYKRMIEDIYNYKRRGSDKITIKV